MTWRAGKEDTRRPERARRTAPPAGGGREPRPVLVCSGVVKVYPTRDGLGLVRSRRGRPVVDLVDLEVRAGETFALVGESGCGKTTLARMAVGLIEPTAGRVSVDGVDLGRLRGAPAMSLRRKIQIVFQDPAGALDPRQRVAGAIAEPLRLHHSASPSERRREVERLLGLVGLGRAEGRRFPHQLSGGQKQRVLIARALALRPSLVVLDEPVSALDVSVRAQIINLLASLQREFDLSYLLISHDLGVVRRIARRTAVMHRGRIVEQGPVDALWSGPAHPYTRDLLLAAPVADPARRPPPPERPPAEETTSPAEQARSSCYCAPFCPRAGRLCLRQRPRLEPVPRRSATAGHLVACHFPLS